MGTEVLRPQDCLVERLRVGPAGFHGRRHYIPHGYTTKTYRKPGPARTEPRRKYNNYYHNQHQQHQECSSYKRCGPSTDDLNGARPMMGQVTLLRRGQSLDSLNSKIKSDTKSTSKAGGEGDLVAYGTERLGPEQPEMLPKQIRVGRLADVYAGSAFSVSPSPSSLPLPSFFKKQELKPFDDSATRDLRRLLRLD